MQCRRTICTALRQRCKATQVRMVFMIMLMIMLILLMMVFY